MEMLEESCWMTNCPIKLYQALIDRDLHKIWTDMRKLQDYLSRYGSIRVLVKGVKCLSEGSKLVRSQFFNHFLLSCLATFNKCFSFSRYQMKDIYIHTSQSYMIQINMFSVFAKLGSQLPSEVLSNIHYLMHLTFALAFYFYQTTPRHTQQLRYRSNWSNWQHETWLTPLGPELTVAQWWPLPGVSWGSLTSLAPSSGVRWEERT